VPFPPSLSTVTVTGSFGDLDGEPMSGLVRFHARAPFVSAPVDGVVVAMEDVLAHLDRNGSFSVELLATDDTDANPTGWSYEVTICLQGVDPLDPFDIALPAADPTVDLTSVIVVDPDTGDVIGTGAPGPPGPPGTAAVTSGLTFTNLLAAPTTPTTGPTLYSRATPSGGGDDELVMVTRTGEIIPIPDEVFVTPRKFGAHPDEDPATNAGALQAAVTAAAATGRQLMIPDGTYEYDDTLLWTADDGYLSVLMSRAAELRYTGTGWGWDLDMDSGVSDLPAPTFLGGRLSRTSDAEGTMWCKDVRQGVWRDVTFDCVDTDAGIGLLFENEGRWFERNVVELCRFVDNQHAIYGALHRVTPATKQKNGGTARIVFTGAHRFQVGDRLDVELSPADTDYDGDRQITAIGGDWVEFVTTAGVTGATATAGTVASRGSYARLIVQDITLTGGVPTFSHLHFEEGTGPYDGRISDIRGNIADDTSVLHIRPGAWAGTKVGNIGVELATGTACYLVDAPDDWTGGRPEWVGEARTTAAVLFYRVEPTGLHPWTPLTLRGGVQTEAPDFVDLRAGGLAIPDKTGADPDDSDYYDGSPPLGTVHSRSDADKLFARRGGGTGGDWPWVHLDHEGALGHRLRRLTADSTRASATVAVETGLSVDAADIPIGTTWILDGLLIVTIAGAATGIDVALDMPGGAPASVIRWGDDLDNAVTTQATTTPVERPMLGAGTYAVRLHGTITFGQFAGLDFLWGQTVTDAGNPATLHDGSWLAMTRIT
jgi:hypothetical protein